MLALFQRICESKVAVLLLGLAAAAAAALAGNTGVPGRVLVPDTAIGLGGQSFIDEQSALSDVDGIESIQSFTLPPGVAIAAIDRLGPDHWLLVFDTYVDLGSGLVAGPRDVVELELGGYTLRFSAAGAGVPDGTEIDAVADDPSGRYLLLSFDTVFQDTVNQGIFDPTLAVYWDTVDERFTGFVVGPTLATLTGGELDGLDWDGDDRYYVSFAGGGSWGGVEFDDEDILDCDASGNCAVLFHELWLGDLDLASFAVVPDLIFADGFEGQTLGEWSSAVGG